MAVYNNPIAKAFLPVFLPVFFPFIHDLGPQIDLRSGPACASVRTPFHGVAEPEGVQAFGSFDGLAPTVTVGFGCLNTSVFRTCYRGIPAEDFVSVLLFDFGRRHGLREGQREGVATIGRGLAVLCTTSLLSSTPHPSPSTL
jgi:hypothetical protein